MKVLDTTFLVDLIRGKKEAAAILQCQEPLLTTQINLYEILEGFFRKNISSKKYVEIMELFENIHVLPLDDMSIIKAAEISASLAKKGLEVPDCDCLIAGSAVSKGISTIVTKDKEHFRRMKGIIVEEY